MRGFLALFANPPLRTPRTPVLITHARHTLTLMSRYPPPNEHIAFHALPDAVGAIRCTLYLYTHLVALARPIWLSIPAVLQ